jgi:hypothetical protein
MKSKGNLAIPLCCRPIKIDFPTPALAEFNRSFTSIEGVGVGLGVGVDEGLAG